MSYKDLESTLLISEMIKIASWVKIWKETEKLEYKENWMLNEVYDFSWDYYGKVPRTSLEIYLHKNAGYSWRDKYAIKVLKDGKVIGFSGRLKKKKSKELVNLCTNVEEESPKKPNHYDLNLLRQMR